MAESKGWDSCLENRMTHDKREYYYKHQPLTPEQERENEALVELILRQQEENKETPCPTTSK